MTDEDRADLEARFQAMRLERVRVRICEAFGEPAGPGAMVNAARMFVLAYDELKKIEAERVLF